MKVGGYLKSRQPIIYRSFSNALKKDSLTHSYLLLGEEGTPLLEVATYLAKSILCDHPNPLADEECITCRRIEKGEYHDIAILNGEEGLIKKEQIQEVISDFQQTPLEKKGKMIYIVHLVESMRPEAVNSLLKFLEEPPRDTFAILTSKNEAKLLPTIVSRCQSMRLLLIPRKEIIEATTSAEVALEDAEMLSYFYNDADLVKQAAESKAYQSAKAAINATLSGLSLGKEEAIYAVEKDAVALLSDRPGLRYYFDMLCYLFKDMIRIKVGDEAELSSYAKILVELSTKLAHPEATLKQLMSLRGEVESNINATLLLAHSARVIVKE